MKSFNIINHCTEVIIPNGYTSVSPKGKDKPVNELGLPAYEHETQHEVIAQFERDWTEEEVNENYLLGVPLVIFTLGLVLLSPDVRNWFSSKDTIRFALVTPEAENYSTIEIIGRTALFIFLAIVTVGGCLCDNPTSCWIGSLIREKKYNEKRDVEKEYVETFIKFGDDELLKDRLPYRFLSSYVNRAIEFSVEHVKNFRLSSEYDAKNERIAIENYCKITERLICELKVSDLKYLRGWKGNSEELSKALKTLMDSMENDRSLPERFSPIIELLMSYGADIQDYNNSEEERVIKMCREHVLAKKNQNEFESQLKSFGKLIRLELQNEFESNLKNIADHMLLELSEENV